MKNEIKVTGFEESLKGEQYVKIWKMKKVDISEWKKEEEMKNECSAPTDKDSIRTK